MAQQQDSYDAVARQLLDSLLHGMSYSGNLVYRLAAALNKQAVGYVVDALLETCEPRIRR